VVRVCVGGTILIGIQGDLFRYGSNVTSSPTYLTRSAQISILDAAHPLPFGQLTHFYLYASPAAGDPANAERRIQLQIWRLLSNAASSRYRLVWQRLAHINTSSSTGALVTVSTVPSKRFFRQALIASAKHRRSPFGGLLGNPS